MQPVGIALERFPRHAFFDREVWGQAKRFGCVTPRFNVSVPVCIACSEKRVCPVERFMRAFNRRDGFVVLARDEMSRCNRRPIPRRLEKGIESPRLFEVANTLRGPSQIAAEESDTRKQRRPVGVQFERPLVMMLRQIMRPAIHVNQAEGTLTNAVVLVERNGFLREFQRAVEQTVRGVELALPFHVEIDRQQRMGSGISGIESIALS